MFLFVQPAALSPTGVKVWWQGGVAWGGVSRVPCRDWSSGQKPDPRVMKEWLDPRNVKPGTFLVFLFFNPLSLIDLEILFHTL